MGQLILKPIWKVKSHYHFIYCYCSHFLIIDYCLSHAHFCTANAESFLLLFFSQVLLFYLEQMSTLIFNIWNLEIWIVFCFVFFSPFFWGLKVGRKKHCFSLSCRSPPSISITAQYHLCLTRWAEHKVLQVFCSESIPKTGYIQKDMVWSAQRKNC